jgi:hypothetical protein
MSYDLQVWTTEEPRLPEVSPEPDGWSCLGGSWTLDRGTWQIVGNVSEVDLEDVPVEVAGALPGLRYLVGLRLEPVSAPESARRFVKHIAADIAKHAHGLVFDPQEDRLKLPSGVTRYSPSTPGERMDFVAMSWWFGDERLKNRADTDVLVSILERFLPEALPKRYGDCEPPSYRYDEAGREHFIGFLGDMADKTIVWYPRRPVIHVHLGIPRPWGRSHRGFRSSLFVVEVESSILQQPGWDRALREFWRQASLFLQPFYGDVRTLRGLVRRGSRYAIDAGTEDHPVLNGWWAGIPRTGGHAVVLGPPYLGLWPELRDTGIQEEGLAFVTNPGWTDNDDVFARMGGVPRSIEDPVPSQRVHGGIRQHDPDRPYPEVWPFGATHI